MNRIRPLLAHPALIAFVLALAVRLAYLYESSDIPSFDMPLVDSLVYHNAALAWIHGEGLSRHFFYQPFFYPLFLAGAYGVSGDSMLLVKVLQAILGAATAALVAVMALRFAGRTAAFAAGAIAALYAPLVYFDGELLAATWAAFWAMLLLFAFLRARQRPGWRADGSFGLLCGLASITQPTFLPFAAIAAVWIVHDRRPRARILSGALAIGIAFAVVVLPVATANRAVTGRFSFLPYSGGLNLYLGNNEDICQTLTIRPGKKWIEITTRPEQEGYSDSEEEAYYLKLVRNYAVGHPLRFLRDIGYKTVVFFSAREIPRNLDIYLFRRWSEILRIGVWKAGRFGFPFGILFPLAVIGLVRERRRIPLVLPLFVAVYALAVAVVFSSARYRVPVIPPLCVLAGAGIAAVTEALRVRTRATLPALGAGLLALLFCVLPGPFCQEADLEAEYYNHLGSAILVENGDIAAWLAWENKALAIRPDYFEIHRAIGRKFVQWGRGAEAIAPLRRAIALDPEDTESHQLLGRALLQTGRNGEAVEAFRRVLAIAPKDASAHGNLGSALFAAGKRDEGIALMREALAMAPETADAYRTLGEALVAYGKPGEALPVLEKGYRIAQNDPALLQAIATACYQTGRFAEAARRLREKLALVPATADDLNNLGMALAQSGSVREGMEQFRRAVALDPENRSASDNLARAEAILSGPSAPTVP